MDLGGKRIAVTGATGFLGRYIVDVLLARGAQVVGVVRNPAKVPELVAKGVDLRQADLAEPDRLAAGFAKADAVVSNAALLSLTNARWGDFEDTNVRGTRHVMRACKDAGVTRVVQVSSVAVYGIFTRGRLHEEAPQLTPATRRLPWNVYPLSKALSEQEAWQLATEYGLALTTVRPSTIYGAFDPNFMRVLRRIMTLPISIKPLGMRLAFVYAGDVAEGIARALEREVSIGRAYNLTGPGEPWEYVAHAWRSVGGATPWLRIPVPLPMAPDIDATRAVRELDWHARSLEEGLRETFQLERAA